MTLEQNMIEVYRGLWWVKGGKHVAVLIAQETYCAGLFAIGTTVSRFDLLCVSKW